MRDYEVMSELTSEYVTADTGSVSHLGNLRTAQLGVILNSAKAQGPRPEDRPVTSTAYRARAPRWAEGHFVHLGALTPSWEELVFVCLWGCSCVANTSLSSRRKRRTIPQTPSGRSSFHKDSQVPSPASTWCHLNR